MIDQALATLRVLPFLLPGAVLAAVVGWLVARRAARRRAWTGAAVAWGLLLLVLGLDPAGGLRRHPCDLTRWVPLDPRRWLETSSDALNVWVFVVLGVLAARAHRPRLTLGLAALLPVAIEAGQTLLPRDCTAFDAVNNWVGLALGAALGLAVGSVCEAAHMRRPRV